MDRLTMEYCGGYAPRELCGTNRFGEVIFWNTCGDYCGNDKHGCAGCAIDACFTRLGEYENTGLTPEQIAEMDGLYKAKCEELAEYKARQQDNTLNLPCKIGQEVYIVNLSRVECVGGEVTSIRIGAHGASLRIYVPSSGQYINRAFEQIGKSVFFNRAAASKGLKT